jgi:hypothetical protein
MSMRKYLIIIIVAQCSFLFGQGEIDEQDKIFYRNERTFAFLLNSNGFGGNFRYAKRIDAFRKTLYEIELNYLKHPKEQKVTVDNTNRNIVYGKLNSVYTLKGAIGFQKEMFRKQDFGSISIRYFFNFGPTLAFQKPVYYEYFDSKTNDYYYEKFQEHNYDVSGKAPFTMGFGEITVSPGAYGKFGYSFEYSKVDAVFHALEASIALDAYVRKIKIMETPPEKILFVLPDDYFVLTLTISYRFGKVIDTKFSPKQNKVDDMLVN